MGRFLNGVLVGMGIGLLVAPMPGEDLRRLLLERYEQARGALPEHINLPVQQVSESVTQTASNVKDSARQAANKVRDTGSTLGNLAQQSASKVQQRGQDTADTAKQAAISVKPGTQASTTIPDEDEDAVDLTLEY